MGLSCPSAGDEEALGLLRCPLRSLESSFCGRKTHVGVYSAFDSLLEARYTPVTTVIEERTATRRAPPAKIAWDTGQNNVATIRISSLSGRSAIPIPFKVMPSTPTRALT